MPINIIGLSRRNKYGISVDEAIYETKCEIKRNEKIDKLNECCKKNGIEETQQENIGTLLSNKRIIDMFSFDELYKLSSLDSDKFEIAIKLFENCSVDSYNTTFLLSKIFAEFKNSSVNTSVLNKIISELNLPDKISKTSIDYLFYFAKQFTSEEEFVKFYNNKAVKTSINNGATYENLAEIEEFSQEEFKIYEELITSDNVDTCLKNSLISIDDIILTSQMNKTTRKLTRKQLISALENPNIQKLLKSKTINLCHIANMTDSKIIKSKGNASFKEKLKSLENPDVILLLEKYNLSLEDIVNANNISEEQMKSIVSFIENSNLKANQYKTNVVKLQNNAGYLLKIKTIKKESVSFNVSISQDGKLVYTRTENKTASVLTRNKGSNKDTYLRNHTPQGSLSEQLELYTDENGEPDYILYTKESQILSGTYDTIKYKLSDYPEEMDVIQAIKNGTISGGETLTKSTINPDGSISYTETYQNDDTTTSRTYSRKMDENDKVLSSQYSYEIVDSDNNKVMSVNRNWTQNNDGSTTTVVNNKEYRTTFDDETKRITIIDEQGKQIKIDFGSKFISNFFGEKINKILENTPLPEFDTSDLSKAQLWEFFKTLPADTLIDINKNINKINKVEGLASTFIDKIYILNIGTDEAITAHEVGHSIDFQNKKKFSKNQELIDIYNQEMENFRNNLTPENAKIISYFSQMGGSGGTGLNEFIAETNSLLTTYGHSSNILSARAMYLVRYFPKTIAKIAELLEY